MIFNKLFNTNINKVTTVILGYTLLFLAIAILLSLFSFSIDDPSFNTYSTNQEIHNWIGIIGSYISDILFQFIGFSSFFLCLILFVFGIKIITNNTISYFLFRITLTPFFLISISIFFSCINDPSWWAFTSLGGVIGKFLSHQLESIPWVITLISSIIISSILLSLIIEIKIADWKYFFRYNLITIKYILRMLFNVISKLVFITTGKKITILDDTNTKYNNRITTSNKSSNTTTAPNNRIQESTLSTKTYKIPPVNLLLNRANENKNKKTDKSSVSEQSNILIKVLKDYGVHGESIGIKLGPVVTLHEFEPVAGTKSSRIIGLSDDIARSMSAVSTRISTIPGKTTIGIELPNKNRETIFLREMIESEEYKYSQDLLPIILGKNIGGEPVIADLSKMPHLLIAGTTGSGKSVGVNAMILSLLYKMTPQECKFIMIDPKMLELSVYNGIPHLLSPVVTEPKKAVIALKWIVNEMEERYRLMSSLNVRNIDGYNNKIKKAIKNEHKLTRNIKTGFDPHTGEPIIERIEIELKTIPFIVVIIDEMADLMMVAGKEIESSIQRLAQMARAAGIHLIAATQRPSVDVITGVIKANFPTRISFQVTSRIDSRTALGIQGAEQLLGQGDMLYMSGGNKLIRVHGPFCSDKEVENIINFIKAQSSSDTDENKIEFEKFDDQQNEESNNQESGQKDTDLYKKAVNIVRRDQKASISYVQRQLQIGYNRAANLIERMEEEGVVTKASKSGKREVINP